MMNPQNRDISGKFKCGCSGNPGGRPKVAGEVRELLAQNTTRAVETVIALLDSENEKVALQAAQEVLNRVLGKSIQAQSILVETAGQSNFDLTAQIHAIILRHEEERRQAELEEARRDG